MMNQSTNRLEHGLPNHLMQHELTSNDVLLKNYSRHAVEFVKGEGSYLYDSAGNKYLDFLSGIAVTGFGHNHPEIKLAVEEQLKKLWHVSNLFEAPDQKELALKLVNRSGLSSVFFCNSGTEANEAAIKFARKWGKDRTNIITALGSFHGRTMGSLSASGQFKVWNGFHPLTPGFVYVPYGDIEAIENSFNEHVGAIILEPIQGESGIIIPPEGYLKKVREFCDKNDILLILDEVQTGMGRTGKFFAHEHEGIKPDIVTLAKGIANGMPLGAVVCSEEISNEIKPGDHGSTFGGNPIAIAASNKVVDLINDDLLDKVTELGNKLLTEIKSSFNKYVKCVRGKGLMIGIEFNESVSAKDVSAKLLENGIITCPSGNNVLRLLPPYIIEEKEILQFKTKFYNVVSGP